MPYAGTACGTVGAGFPTDGVALADADGMAEALALAVALTSAVAVVVALGAPDALVVALGLALVPLDALAEPSLVATSPLHARSDSVAPISVAAPSGARGASQKGQRASWMRT